MVVVAVSNSMSGGNSYCFFAIPYDLLVITQYLLVIT